MYKIYIKCAKLYRGDSLKIYTEYRLGILFIRLSGRLTKDTVKKINNKVALVISNTGIRKVVFNVEGLSKIDYKGINSLLYIYELTKKNKGQVFICGVNMKIDAILKRSHLFNYINLIPNELCALRVLKG